MPDESPANAGKPAEISLPVRIGFIFGIVALFFGLSVVAWGGFTAFFSQPALIALTVVTVVLVIASIFAGGNLSSGEREDRGNR